MSTVSFCCRDCSTPGATLRRNDTIASLDIILAAWWCLFVVVDGRERAARICLRMEPSSAACLHTRPLGAAACLHSRIRVDVPEPNFQTCQLSCHPTSVRFIVARRFINVMRKQQVHACALNFIVWTSVFSGDWHTSFRVCTTFFLCHGV